MTKSTTSGKIAYLLVIISLILILFNILRLIMAYAFGHPYLFGLSPLIDIDREMNFPTLFSTLLLLLCSLLIYLISGAQKKAGKGDARWSILATIFLFLSIDEFSSIHELLIVPVRTWLNTGGMLYFAWVIPFVIITIILAAIYIPFIIRLPVKIRLLTFVAATLYVSGALGIEMLGGVYFEAIGEQRTLIYELITMVEESLEIFGLTLYVYTLLLFWRSTDDTGSFQLKLTS